MSSRHHLLAFLLLMPPGLPAQEPSIKAGQIVAKMRANLGVEWERMNGDGFKSGSEETVIGGVTVTLFPTHSVLKKAAESGHNLVICHEPLFYTGIADPLPDESDPVLDAKKQLIADHDIAVFRFHDNIHRMVPDSIHLGLIDQLGWAAYRKGESDELFTVPPTTIENIAKEVGKRLETRSVRVIGDPTHVVTRLGLSAGAWHAKEHIRLLRRDDVELLLIGESREWQTVEYVRDALDQGKNKALIIMGHNASEEAGMEWCARWMKSFVKEVPVVHVPSEQPYWTPAE